MKLNKKSFLGAIAFLCIYSLHLFFIQVLMIDSYESVTESFTSFFNSNSEHPYPHPPATQFYQIHKHYNKENKTVVPVNFTAAINYKSVFCIPTIAEFRPAVNINVPPLLGDDAYKRYCLNQTFLI